MPAATTNCPSCDFENHSTSRFCIGCGTKLPASEVAEPQSPGGPAVPVASPEPQGESTKRLLQRIAEESGFASQERQGGLTLQVPLPGDRKQTVHVLFDGKDDDGHEVLTFLSVCGKADAAYDRVLLESNNRITYCAFAVRKIQGKTYFVVTASQLVATADLQELRKVIDAVARRADRLEATLGGGDRL